MRISGRIKSPGLKAILFALLFLCLAVYFLISDLTYNVTYNADPEAMRQRMDSGHSCLETEAFSLRPGIWQISVSYSPDDTGSSLFSEAYADIAPGRMWACESDRIPLPYYKDHLSYRIYVHGETVPVRIKNTLESTAGNPDIHSISISFRSLKTLGYDLGRLLFAAFITGLLLFGGSSWRKLSAERRLHILGFSGIIFLSILPVCTYYIAGGHDANFHLYRIIGLAQGLADGQFPVRLQPLWANGHGYPVSIMYGDLMLYPAAVLYLIGFPLHSAFRVLLLYLTALTALSADWAVGHIFCRKSSSETERTILCLSGSALYVLNIWRLTDVYTRFAVGEYAAMIFLPLIAAGAFNLLSEEHAGDRYQTAVLFAAGFTGLLQTHLVTFFLAALAMVVFVLVYCRKIRAAGLRLLFAAAVFTILINLWFIVPFIDYSLKQNLYVFTVENSLQQNSVMLFELFSTRFMPALHSLRGFSVQEHPMTVGLGLLFGLMACIAGDLAGIFKTYRKPIRALWISCVICLFLSSMYFPYDWFNAHMHRLYQIYGSIEFAYRIFPILILLLILLILSAARELSAKYPAVSAVFLSLLVAVTVFQAVRYESDYRYDMDETAAPLIDRASVYDFGSFLEYTLVGTGDYFKIPSIEASDGAYVQMIGRRNLSFDVSALNPSLDAAAVKFPVCGYKGMKAWSGNRELISWADPDNAELLVELPPGFSGEIHVAFKNRWYWRAADIISLICLMAWVLFRRRIAEKLRN